MVPADTWWRDFEVNLRGAALPTRIVLDGMVRARPRTDRLDVERHGERAEPVLLGLRLLQVRARRPDGADRGRGGAARRPRLLDGRPDW
jgi:hypothetical protein